MKECLNDNMREAFTCSKSEHLAEEIICSLGVVGEESSM